MKIDRIQPAGMNVRMQQGKPAYSHVVTVTGPGKTIYIAGQLARNAEGNIVGQGDMRAQLEQTFKNVWRAPFASGFHTMISPVCVNVSGLGEDGASPGQDGDPRVPVLIT